MRHAWRALLLGALLLLVSAPAGGHSLLLESSPAAGGLAPSPSRISLRFNNRIEKRLSRLRLVDPRGTAHPIAILPDGAPERLEATLPVLESGAYRLEWHVLSTDGHVVSGTIPFRVGP